MNSDILNCLHFIGKRVDKRSANYEILTYLPTTYLSFNWGGLPYLLAELYEDSRYLCWKKYSTTQLLLRELDLCTTMNPVFKMGSFISHKILTMRRVHLLVRAHHIRWDFLYPKGFWEKLIKAKVDQRRNFFFDLWKAIYLSTIISMCLNVMEKIVS